MKTPFFMSEIINTYSYACPYWDIMCVFTCFYSIGNASSISICVSPFFYLYKFIVLVKSIISIFRVFAYVHAEYFLPLWSVIGFLKFWIFEYIKFFESLSDFRSDHGHHEHESYYGDRDTDSLVKVHIIFNLN